MKLFKRIFSTAAAAAVLSTVAAVMPAQEASAATIVIVSPYDVYDINGGKFEGWGTSLCWWANRVGYSDTLAQKAADTFVSPDGLGLNIARFNIGGGDDPSERILTAVHAREREQRDQSGCRQRGDDAVLQKLHGITSKQRMKEDLPPSLAPLVPPPSGGRLNGHEKKLNQRLSVL